MSYARPGIYVDEVLLQNNIAVNSTTAVAAFVGAALRGPTKPVRMNSWTDVTRNFGQFTGLEESDRLLQALYNALSNGAGTIYAARVVGAGAEEATLTFNLDDPTPLDAPATPGATAMRFTAINPGTWGNQLYIEVTNGSTADRFSLNLRLVPTGAAITNQQIVERWTDVSLDPRDNRYLLGLINSVLGGSSYVTVAVEGAYTYTAADRLANSTVPGGDKLAGGANGAAVVESDFQTSIYNLDEVSQPFVLNLPGITDIGTITVAANYADASRTRADGDPGRGDVFVVVDCQLGVDEATAIATKSTYPRSDVLAMYYPGLVIADATNAVRGSTKLVPPGASVVGRYLATDAARGVFKAPAGVNDGLIQGVLALDPAARLRNSDLDALNNANVNAIKSMPGISPAVIFAARTLRSDYITRYVNARRTLISVRADLKAAVAFAPFENNDQVLWSALFNAADRICRQLLAAGGLKGPSAAAAYYVVCGPENNTAVTVEAGEVHLEVGLALQRPAEFVVIKIGQFEGGISVTELAA
jgi:hypothetical protein